MRVGIVGSRSCTDMEVVEAFFKKWRDRPMITEIVSGGADGADFLGKQFAQKHGIPYTEFTADWTNLEGVPASRIKVSKGGRRYDPLAGHIRNQRMADYIDDHRGCVIAFWDGISPGTKQMLKYCKSIGLTYEIVEVK